MPRSFDSDDVARATQPALLRFTENTDCPGCGATFEAVFTDDSISVEDITDPPQGTHHCPGCGHRWTSTLTGWTFYSEAG